MAKATKAEVQERVNAIYQLILVGASRKDIIQFASSQEWGVTNRQVDTYARKARELFAAEASRERNEYRDESYMRLMYILSRCLEVQDYKTALSTQKEINELFGLKAPKRSEITGADGDALTVRIVYEDILDED